MAPTGSKPRGKCESFDHDAALFVGRHDCVDEVSKVTGKVTNVDPQ